MNNILITGGAGFIGSNLIHYFLEKTDFNIVNLDKLTYAGNLENLRDVEKHTKYTFIMGDICDKKLVDSLFEKYDFIAVFHLAAESHVDRSLDNPAEFTITNVLGTQILAEAARKWWAENPSDKYCKKYKDGCKFVHISTDEVYGVLPGGELFKESTPLAPNSPYSASKAGSDLVIRSYFKSFGFPMNITRCSNNYGPYQFPEKLIPLMIHNAINDKKLPVYGDGLQVRDWLHVSDHCAAILSVYQNGKAGEVYNIGGNNEKANLDIVKLILEELSKPNSLISFVKDRPGHDRRYAIDNTKISTELKWAPLYTFEQGIMATIMWYKENPKWIDNILSDEYTKK